MPESSAADWEESFEIPHNSKFINCIRRGREPPALVFTHGAGGTLSSGAVQEFCSGFSTISSIVCFQGNMNLKSRAKMFGAVTTNQGVGKCLGGRSMGARAAVIAATENTEFLVLVSYPLHTEKEVRDQILLDLRPEIQVLFIIGDNDSMCHLDRLQVVREKMRCKTWLARVKSADHGMGLKPKAGTAEVRSQTGKLAAKWLEDRSENETECEITWDAEEEIARSIGWTPNLESQSKAAKNKIPAVGKTGEPHKRSRSAAEQISDHGAPVTRSSKRRNQGV